MRKPKYKTETETKFYIIAGSLADLSKFDFSSFNTQCIKVNSDMLDSICDGMTDDEFSNRTKELLKEISVKFRKSEQPFVLLPIDFTKEFIEKNLISCYELILLLFPGDLAIYGLINFQLFDYKYIHLNSYLEYGFYSSGRENYYDNFVYYQEDSLGEINRFIKLYNERKNGIEYLETTVNGYISSFRELRPDMAFLNLCISLESIVEGNTELSYRIKRNVAILCAENKHYAEKIFDNLNLIYGLRSRIVHAGKFKYEKVDEYLPYLQSLVSRLIIELILQNIQSLSVLNRSLIFAGFGDRKELITDSDYEPMTLNISSYVDTFVEELKK